MTRAVFEKQNGRFCGLVIEGHAGQAAAGENIVCAAISSAVQYATILITESFHEQDEETAEGETISVRLKKPSEGNGSRVLEGLYQHLKCVSEDYPGTISIKIMEV